jgi:hypothetical protein
VSALRGLPFKHPVRSGTQTREQFRAYVRGEMEREMPAPRRAALGRAYAQMGVLPPRQSLDQVMEEALTTQVAAYYDPRTQRFHRIARPGAGPRKAEQELSIIAHELTHALQDQHFDLLAFDGSAAGASTLDDDARNARRFVTEGEATFVMMAWQISGGSGAERRLGPLMVAGLRMGIAMLAAADQAELVSALRQGGHLRDLDAADRRDMESLVNLPPAVMVPLVEPYLKGAQLVSEVWGRGGWAAVDDLFKRPPESTEQALHPVEKLLARRDPPVRLRLAADPPAPLAGAARLSSDVIGELGWRAYFKTWRHPAPEAAAAGWGGDRYWAWTQSGRPVVLTGTRWDSEPDARRFFAAYVATLARRFPAPDRTQRGSSVRLRRPDGGLLAVVLRGRDVDIADGARPADLEALLAALASAERSP